MATIQELENNLESILRKEDLVIITPSVVKGDEMTHGLSEKLDKVSFSIEALHLEKEVQEQIGYYYMLQKVLNNDKVMSFKAVEGCLSEKLDCIEKKANELIHNEGKTKFSNMLYRLRGKIKSACYVLSSKTKHEETRPDSVFYYLYGGVNLIKEKINTPHLGIKYNHNFDAKIITNALYQEIANNKNPAILTNNKFLTELFIKTKGFCFSSEIGLNIFYKIMKKNKITLYSSLENGVYLPFKESGDIYSIEYSSTRPKDPVFLGRLKEKMHKAENAYKKFKSIA